MQSDTESYHMTMLKNTLFCVCLGTRSFEHGTLKDESIAVSAYRAS